MAIVQTVDESLFHGAFHDMGRAKQFSYEGRAALFDWLEEYSEGQGEPFELDVIALCCDFAEYTHAELRAEYDNAPREDPDDPDDDELLEWLRDQTTVIEFARHNPHTGENVNSVILGPF